MKENGNVLYPKAVHYSVLILFILNIAFLPNLGNLLKGSSVQVPDFLKDPEMGKNYNYLCLMIMGLSNLVGREDKNKSLGDQAFISKYVLPLTLLLLPLLDSLIRCLFNVLLAMYQNPDHTFYPYYFLWIPLLALVYLYHRHLEKVYEEDYQEEDLESK